MSHERADAVAAWATGAGIGLVALMLTWLIGNRLVGLLLDPPLGPIVAFGSALASGGIAAVVAGRRLRRSVDRQGAGGTVDPAPSEGTR